MIVDARFPIRFDVRPAMQLQQSAVMGRMIKQRLVDLNTADRQTPVATSHLVKMASVFNRR